MVDRVGERFGDYGLKRLISDRGAFADVYEAEHVVDQTKAAVKVWKVYIEARTFLNDVRAALLRHPHIVEILDFNIKGDVPYLIMAYAPNGSLQAQSLPLPLESIMTYVRQIAEALHFAHQRGIVHRDIKPDNILLGLQHEIWVGDFGIATPSFTRQDTLLGEPEKRLTGTPDYMAPEQWEDRISPACDQYALGIMVYEWVCGERPFRGNLVALYHKHTNEPPPLLRDKRPMTSPAVEQVVMRALEKNPENRFPSVLDFAGALEQACLAEQFSNSAVQVIEDQDMRTGASPLEDRVDSSADLDAQTFNPRRARTGQILNEQFKVVQILDESYWETVCKVEQIGINPPHYYVVKELAIEADHKAVIRQFEKEIDLLRVLKHPHIASTILTFQESGNYYYVTEFVDGHSMNWLLEDNKGPLPEEKVIKWMTQICEALSYLHSYTPPTSKGHLLPWNILITPGDEAQLLIDDTCFEWYLLHYPMKKRIARNLRNISFDSPEYLHFFGRSSQKVDARSDIYSLGAIIYHLLTNDEPGPTTTPQVGSILAKNPRLHTIQVNGKTVCPIEQVIIKSMQQAPELRFQNANAMRAALEYCLSKLRKPDAFYTATTNPDAPEQPTEKPVEKPLPEDALLQGQKAPKPEIPPRIQAAIDWMHNRHRLLDESDYEEALAACDEAIKIAPTRIDFYLEKAFALQRLNRNEEALAVYDEATKIDPNDSSVQGNKADLLEKLGRHEEALAAYDQAIRINPNKSHCYISKAILLEKLGRYEEALAVYNQLIGIDGIDSSGASYIFMVYSAKAELLIKLERHEEALAVCDEEIRIDPSSPYVSFIYEKKGDLLEKLRRYGEALVAYDQAYKIYQGTLSPFIKETKLLAHVGRIEEALAAYDREIDKEINAKPESYFMYEWKARFLRELGRYEEALAIYDQIIRIAQPFANTHFIGIKRDIFQELGKYEEAIAACDQSLSIYPHDSSVQVHKAKLLTQLGRHEEALAIYDQVIEHHSLAYEAYMAKADLLEKLGRHEEALAVYDQVTGIDSRGVHAIYMAYVAKADLLDRLERHEEAQKVREEKERREEEDSIL